jgi:2-methylcitrate dehydratase PrpD
MQTYSAKCDWREITGELGTRFEIAANTYKPFACGIVIHPTIDGCVQLREKHRIRPDDVERVELRVHSLVLELTGKKAPRWASRASSASTTRPRVGSCSARPARPSSRTRP